MKTSTTHAPRPARKNRARLAIVLSLLLCLLAAAAGPSHASDIYLDDSTTPPNSYNFAAELARILSEIETQAEVERNLLLELEQGHYTLQEPFLAIDPYNCAPLCALVLFNTPSPARVSIHIPGQSEAASVRYYFSSFTTTHMIPVYGLYPNAINAVKITATDEAGAEETVTLSIRPGSVFATEPQETIATQAHQPSDYSEGFNFAYLHMYAFDIDGAIRWQHIGNTLQAKRFDFDRGIYMAATGSYVQGDVLLFERNLLGKYLRVYHSPYGLHHDIEPTDHNTLLATGETQFAQEDLIYEIDRASGEIINTLDLKSVLSDNLYHAPDKRPEWLHMNAVNWLSGDIIISARNASCIARLKWPEGDLRWILGSPSNGWLPAYEAYMLTPIGAEDFEWPFFQHTPVVLPDVDDNPDTLDLLVFDNGRNRFSDGRRVENPTMDALISLSRLYSRMVQYRVDERAMTVEQVWTYGKEAGLSLYADRRSGTQHLPNGNIYGLFALRKDTGYRKHDSARFLEINEAGEIVWEATASTAGGSYVEHMAVRLPLYGESDNDLMLGTPAELFIPQEVYDRYDLPQ